MLLVDIDENRNPDFPVPPSAVATGSCDGKGEAGGGRTNKEQQHEHNNKNNKKAG